MSYRFLALLLCSVVSTFSFSQSSRSTESPTLFSVNKKPVSTAEFLYLYRKNHQDPKTDYTIEKIEEYLQLYINFKLKVQEARRRGMDTTEAFRREFNQYRDELRKPYLPGNNLIDSLMRITYARMQEEVRASHILINVSPDASPEDTLKAYSRITMIRNKIIQGEDFAAAARQYSEDPSAKTNAGDLGFFTALQMVFPFENAAFNTPVGEISQPVRTRFGYHVLKTTDRRPASGEVEVSHIMIRAGEERSDEEARDIAFDVHNELHAGAAWDELCKKYSEDPGTKESGGRLRPFGVGVMGNVPEFERVAFELERPGQISDPVRTRYGWHILRLERKIPVQSYESISSTLRSRVTRDERSQISRQAVQARLRRDLGFSEYSSAKDKLLSLADSTLKTASWKGPSLKMNEPLFAFDGRTFSQGDFVAYAVKSQKPNSQEPARYLEQLYNAYVDASMMEIQERKIASRNPEYQFLLNEYYEGILLFEIMEKEVWNKASDDSVGQANYFREHGAKYTAPERVKATIYSANAAAPLDELKTLVEANDEQKLREHISRHKIRTESGYFKKDEKAILRQVPWEPGIFSSENNGMYYLAWIKEVLPAGQMSFDEARPSLISDYQNFLEAKWVAELKKKYPVKVNKKGKTLIVQQLQNNPKN